MTHDGPVPLAAPAGVGESRRSPFSRLLGASLYLAVAVAVFQLWRIRDEGNITAESGLGYALGIAGVSLTGILLTYPLRKRLRFMRNWGAVEHWFRIHMFLGVLAPALILIHCNFSFGSLNSSVALASMLIVAASGVLGRYVYTRIHYGLYGAKATVTDLRRVVEDQTDRIGQVLGSVPAIQHRLVDYAERSLSPPRNIVFASCRILTMGLRTRLARISINRAVSSGMKQAARRADWSYAQRRRATREARRFVSTYLGTIRRTVQLSFYERLFALWHVLHIPLFFMMVIATTIHVVAVHMY